MTSQADRGHRHSRDSGDPDRTHVIDHDAEAVLDCFRKMYVEDCYDKSRRPASEYEARFKGFEKEIREEYDRLSRRVASEDPKGERWILHYRLDQRLGSGGQADVFSAVDTKLGRRVAIKLPRWSVAPSCIERFHREQMALARFQDPRLCPIYEAGQDGDQPFIVMPHIPGRQLAELIGEGPGCIAFGGGEENTPKSVAALVRFFVEVAEALHKAHETGVIHRDIKPHNIQVRPDCSPVILDFGLAAVRATGAKALTVPGDVMGTHYYMSPEQLEGREVLESTDVWSLGVTLYECLLQRQPFDGDTREQLREDVLRRQPEDPCRLNRLVSKDLSAVVMQALEKNPNDRYSSAKRFAKDLDRVQRGHPAQARRTCWRAAVKYVRRNRVACAVTASVSLLALVALVLWLAQIQAVKTRNKAISAVVVFADVLSDFDSTSTSKSRDFREFVDALGEGGGLMGDLDVLLKGDPDGNSLEAALERERFLYRIYRSASGPALAAELAKANLEIAARSSAQRDDRLTRARRILAAHATDETPHLTIVQWYLRFTEFWFKYEPLLRDVIGLAEQGRLSRASLAKTMIERLGLDGVRLFVNTMVVELPRMTLEIDQIQESTSARTAWMLLQGLLLGLQPEQTAAETAGEVTLRLRDWLDLGYTIDHSSFRTAAQAHGILVSRAESNGAAADVLAAGARALQFSRILISRFASGMRDPPDPDLYLVMDIIRACPALEREGVALLRFLYGCYLNRLRSREGEDWELHEIEQLAKWLTRWEEDRGNHHAVSPCTEVLSLIDGQELPTAPGLAHYRASFLALRSSRRSRMPQLNLQDAALASVAALRVPWIVSLDENENKRWTWLSRYRQTWEELVRRAPGAISRENSVSQKRGDRDLESWLSYLESRVRVLPSPDRFREIAELLAERPEYEASRCEALVLAWSASPVSNRDALLTASTMLMSGTKAHRFVRQAVARGLCTYAFAPDLTEQRVDVLRRSIAIQPTPLAMDLLTRTLDAAGRLEEAQAVHARLRQKFPVYEPIGRILSRPGRHQPNAGAMRTALFYLEQLTQDRATDIPLPWSTLSGGEQQLVRVLSNISLRIEPTAWAHLLRGQWLLESGDWDSGLSTWKRAEESAALCGNPERVSAQVAGWFWAYAETLADASRRYVLFERAVKLNPQPRWCHALGEKYLADRDVDRARELFKRSLQLDPSFEPAAKALTGLAK